MAPATEGSAWLQGSAQAQVLDYHLSMLLDEARMESFRRAIDATVRPGDVVLDIGAGTGVLSFMACQAGASRVYAVEGGPVIEVARQLAQQNGFDDRVVFINDWSTNVDLPDLADVLVSETIGNAGLDEGILAWTADARARLLRSGAQILPRRLRLWTAGVESFDDHCLVSDWSLPSIGLDLAAVRHRAERTLWHADIAPEQILTQPSLAADIDLRTAFDQEITASGQMRVERVGQLHGLTCWFDSLLSEGVTVDNYPSRSDSSWAQTFLPIGEPLTVGPGDLLEWELAVSADGERWTWRLDLAMD